MFYFSSSPDMTDFELIRNKYQDQQDGELKKLSEHISNYEKLKKLIEDNLALMPVKLETKIETHVRQKATSLAIGKESAWVENLEKMIPLIAKGLPYLEVKSDLDYTFVLSTWAVLALQLDSQIAKIIGLNIRSLKAGLNLAKQLCHFSADIADQLSALNLAQHLISILYAKHVASSIKISSIHVLDAMTNWPMQLCEFMYGENFDSNPNIPLSDEGREQPGYAQIVKLCLEPQTARVTAGLNQLVHKIHIFECMREIQFLVHSLVLEKIPDEYAYVSEDEISEEDYNEDVNNVDMIAEDETQNELHEGSNLMQAGVINNSVILTV